MITVRTFVSLSSHFISLISNILSLAPPPQWTIFIPPPHPLPLLLSSFDTLALYLTHPLHPSIFPSLYFFTPFPSTVSHTHLFTSLYLSLLLTHSRWVTGGAVVVMPSIWGNGFSVYLSISPTVCLSVSLKQTGVTVSSNDGRNYLLIAIQPQLSPFHTHTHTQTPCTWACTQFPDEWTVNEIMEVHVVDVRMMKWVKVSEGLTGAVDDPHHPVCYSVFLIAITNSTCASFSLFFFGFVNFSSEDTNVPTFCPILHPLMETQSRLTNW